MTPEQIVARARFEESRGLVQVDRFAAWLGNGPKRIEHAIGSAIGAGALLVIFGWALGRR